MPLRILLCCGAVALTTLVQALPLAVDQVVSVCDSVSFLILMRLRVILLSHTNHEFLIANLLQSNLKKPFVILNIQIRHPKYSNTTQEVKAMRWLKRGCA